MFLLCSGNICNMNSWLQLHLLFLNKVSLLYIESKKSRNRIEVNLFIWYYMFDCLFFIVLSQSPKMHW